MIYASFIKLPYELLNEILKHLSLVDLLYCYIAFRQDTYISNLIISIINQIDKYDKMYGFPKKGDKLISDICSTKNFDVLDAFRKYISSDKLFYYVIKHEWMKYIKSPYYTLPVLPDDKLEHINMIMILAAKQGDWDMIKYCQSNGATEWYRSLINAAEGGHLDIVKYFEHFSAHQWYWTYLPFIIIAVDAITSGYITEHRYFEDRFGVGWDIIFRSAIQSKHESVIEYARYKINNPVGINKFNCYMKRMEKFLGGNIED